MSKLLPKPVAADAAAQAQLLLLRMKMLNQWTELIVLGKRPKQMDLISQLTASVNKAKKGLTISREENRRLRKDC
jgi:hypothetical protein